MDKVNMKKAAWVLPSLSKGSGGLNTIFRNAEALYRVGIKSDFFFPPSASSGETEEELRSAITEWFEYQNPCKIEPLALEIDQAYDFAIATLWNTASFVAAQPCKHKAYFIQDWEPWFYAAGAESLKALSTYNLGLPSITIGRWIAQKLICNGNTQVYHTDFCADPNIYHPLESERKHAICAIYQPDKPRRASSMLIDALSLVKELDPSLTIYLYGSNSPSPSPLFENKGILSREECNELYNKCLCGISMSTSNPSRIPFEMMASGLPVIDLYGEQTIYDLPEGPVVLSNPDSASLASTVISVVNEAKDKTENKVSRSGISFMNERPLELEGKQFARACTAIINEENYPEQPNNKPVYTRKPITATEEAQELEQKRQYDRENQLKLILSPLRVSNKLKIEYKSKSKKLTRATVAIWSHENQNDLTWVELQEQESQPNLWCGIYSPDNKPNTYDTKIWHIHLYGSVDKHSHDKFIYGFDKTINFTAGNETENCSAAFTSGPITLRSTEGNEDMQQGPEASLKLARKKGLRSLFNR